MRWSYQLPFVTTLIAGYLLAFQSTSPTLLLQEPAHIRTPPSLLGAPRPSPLQPYFSCLPHLLHLFCQGWEGATKRCKTGMGATSPPKMLIQVYEAKVSAQLWRAVTRVCSFIMGLKAPLSFLCYLRPQLHRAESKSCTGLLHSSLPWLAAS